MNSVIDQIWEYYREDLSLAEEQILRTLRTVSPAISTIGGHLFSSGGKRIRPFLAILSSKLFGADGDRVRTLACSVEFIHTASLLHDDVVDGASMRRGRASAHSIFGNQAVILAGDFLYANALRLANLLKSQKIMDALCTATARMSEGELIQLSNKGNPDISEDSYMKIVQGKTAVLMSAACRGGAVLGDASPGEESALAAFGLKFGLAFQIADDILDYMAEEETFGKNLGKDLKEGKITLPLVYLLRDADRTESERVKDIIRSENGSESDLTHIYELLHKYRSIDRSHDKAAAILQEAKAELDIFKPSTERSALLSVSDFALNRRK